MGASINTWLIIIIKLVHQRPDQGSGTKLLFTGSRAGHRGPHEEDGAETGPPAAPACVRTAQGQAHAQFPKAKQ